MADSTKSSIRKIFNKLKSYWTSFRESKIGKILFSNSLSYAVSVASIAIAVSGLFTALSHRLCRIYNKCIRFSLKPEILDVMMPLTL